MHPLTPQMLSVRLTLDSKTKIDWKSKNKKKIYQAKRNQKRAGTSVQISEKIEFKMKIEDIKKKENIF